MDRRQSQSKAGGQVVSGGADGEGLAQSCSVHRT